MGSNKLFRHILSVANCFPPSQYKDYKVVTSQNRGDKAWHIATMPSRNRESYEDSCYSLVAKPNVVFLI